MTNGHEIRALGRSVDQGTIEPDRIADTPEPRPAEEAYTLDQEWVDEAADAPPPPRAPLIYPVLAIAAIVAWSGLFGWAIRDAIQAGRALGAEAIAGYVVQWSVPVALIGVIWLILMRSSRAEATRFADSAAAMNRESRALEMQLKVVNRELSLAREFLAAQSRDLESLGRMAAERISAHAAELQALIVSNGAQVDAIGRTSDTALANMNRLRDDLPVIANASRDVANQIGGAGRTAQDHLERLIAAFERLNQFGTASEAQVTRLGAQVEGTLDSFEQQVARIETLVARRFVTLQTEVEAYRDRVDSLESASLSALNERAREITTETTDIGEKLSSLIAATRTQLDTAITSLETSLAEKARMVEEAGNASEAAATERISRLQGNLRAFDAALAERSRQLAEQFGQRQAAFDTHETQASELLTQRLAALDDALAQRREAQMVDAEKLRADGEAIAARIDELGRLIGEISRQSDAAQAGLGAGLGNLEQQLAEKRASLAATEARLAALTESAVRLLEIIQSGLRTTREDLPQAIAAADSALGDVQARAQTVGQLMLDSSREGNELSDYIIRTRRDIHAAREAVAALGSDLAERSDDTLARLQGLRGGFARLSQDSDTLAGATMERLREALGTLETAIAQSFDTLDQGTSEKATSLAARIGTDAVEALERALRTEAAATLGKLEQAAAHAAGVGREATIQLRDQLVRVNELTGNLEQRVARARELAEEQVNNDFARRMALITDSLNSAAIDISAGLTDEVPDTAWDAYLKGDRGIFTRRAVRLIDSGATREIAGLYTRDETFRGNVNRYIHDFEAMLRSMLSTRDGHVLSVTVLGSDMGRLYVMLAQAIQRFRN